MVNNCGYYQIVNNKAFTKDVMFLIKVKVLTGQNDVNLKGLKRWMLVRSQ